MTYQDLHRLRQQSEAPSGFINYNHTVLTAVHSDDVLDPFERWHGHRNPDILLVGQDWGNIEYFSANQGRDANTNPTCRNLSQLFLAAGIDIGSPSAPKTERALHFTNIIPFLRIGNMQKDESVTINSAIIKSMAERFFRPLVLEVLRPKVIITLGRWPLVGVAHAFSYSDKVGSMKEMMSHGPLQMGGIQVYPMYHCGALGLVNRPLPAQKEDWSKLNGKI
jgi:hypothetical protein